MKPTDGWIADYCLQRVVNELPNGCKHCTTTAQGEAARMVFLVSGDDTPNVGPAECRPETPVPYDAVPVDGQRPQMRDR